MAKITDLPKVAPNALRTFTGLASRRLTLRLSACSQAKRRHDRSFCLHVRRRQRRPWGSSASRCSGFHRCVIGRSSLLLPPLRADWRARANCRTNARAFCRIERPIVRPETLTGWPTVVRPRPRAETNLGARRERRATSRARPPQEPTEPRPQSPRRSAKPNRHWR